MAIFHRFPQNSFWVILNPVHLIWGSVKQSKTVTNIASPISASRHFQNFSLKSAVVQLNQSGHFSPFVPKVIFDYFRAGSPHQMYFIHQISGMRSHRFTMMPWSRIGGTVMKLSDLTLSWLTTQLRNPFHMSERTQDTQIRSLVKSLQNHSGQEFQDYVDFSAYFDFHCIWGHFEWSRIPKVIFMCCFTITSDLDAFEVEIDTFPSKSAPSAPVPINSRQSQFCCNLGYAGKCSVRSTMLTAIVYIKQIPRVFNGVFNGVFNDGSLTSLTDL